MTVFAAVLRRRRRPEVVDRCPLPGGQVVDRAGEEQLQAARRRVFQAVENVETALDHYDSAEADRWLQEAIVARRKLRALVGAGGGGS